MKKSSLIGLIVIAIAIMIIVSTAGDASSYVTFEEAIAMSEKGKTDKIHVVGELKKNALGQVIGVHSGPDKLSVSFIMLDDSRQEQVVYFNQPMPTDLLRSEKVVVVGAYRHDKFIADKVLLKCPSKYEETQL